MPRTAGGSLGTLTANQSIYTASSTQNHTIGERLQMGDGRVFYYGKVATTVAAGQLCAPDQSDGGPFAAGVDGACVAITAANRQLGDTSTAITAALAVGDLGVGVTHSSYLDGIVAGQLQNGFIFLNDTGNTNQYYKIKDNTAVGAVTSDVIELLLYDPIANATTDATCSVVIMQNPFMQLALAVSGSDETVVGAPAIACTTASPYVWIQTWGECSLDSNTDTALAGSDLELAGNAGGCQLRDTNGVETRIGYGIADVATAGDGAACYLMLRP